MNRIRPFFFLTLCTLALSLTACEDPSNVGEDLVGGISGEPETFVLAADTLTGLTYQERTGNTPRFLAGRVDDPLLATTMASGYVDFAMASNIPTAFREATVASAELRLTTNYVYGDTTSTVTLRLRDVPDEHTFLGFPADTTLAMGDAIVEFSFNPMDSLVVVPLPAAWIAANDTTLRSTRFATSFHGFELEHVSGNAVVGFMATTAQLRAVAGGQTVNFNTSATPKVFYTASREGTPNLPENTVLVQDGVGAAAKVTYDLEGESLQGQAFNRVLMALYADTTTLKSAPMHFVRPTLRTVTLYGILDNGTTAALAELSLSDGLFSTTRAELVSTGTTTLAALVQGIVDDERSFEYFRIGPPVTNVAGDVGRASTINPVLLYNTDSGDTSPRLVVTASPLN